MVWLLAKCATAARRRFRRPRPGPAQAAADAVTGSRHRHLPRSVEAVCYYADEEYSAGSIIEVDGEFQECVDDDGTMLWQTSRSAQGELDRSPTGQLEQGPRRSLGSPAPAPTPWKRIRSARS